MGDNEGGGRMDTLPYTIEFPTKMIRKTISF